jgi:hypothetical protein
MQPLFEISRYPIRSLRHYPISREYLNHHECCQDDDIQCGQIGKLGKVACNNELIGDHRNKGCHDDGYTSIQPIPPKPELRGGDKKQDKQRNDDLSYVIYRRFKSVFPLQHRGRPYMTLPCLGLGLLVLVLTG